MEASRRPIYSGTSPMDFDFNETVMMAHATAAGWAVGSVSAKDCTSPFDNHAFYLSDYRTGHSLVMHISKETFQRHAVTTLLSTVELAGGLAEIMLLSANGALTPQVTEALSSCLINYTKNTQVYRRLLAQSQATDRLHMVINLYAIKGHKQDAQVRPFALRSDKTFIDAMEVMTASRQVMALDKSNHPEWF